VTDAQLNNAFEAYPYIMSTIETQESTPADFCAYLAWAYISGV